MESPDYKYTLPIQLRFNDIDKFGHVNNAVYFSYYDLAKTEYFSTICHPIDWTKTGIVVVNIDANFMHQITDNENIAVQTSVTEIGNTSFKLAQRIIDTITNEVKCVCSSVMVLFDLTHQTTTSFRPEWVQAICDYEGHDVRRKNK